MMFNKEELIAATGAKILKDTVNKDCLFNISTDTRTINHGDIYLPLKGTSFDGEQFIKNALTAGAKAYFTTKDEIFNDSDLVLKVLDTKEAYLKIAQYYREKINPYVIGITGSSGKTTTKEIVYSVLSQKFKTHKTFSNHNNEIGFCQTVLGMDKDTEVLIVEMGMRGLGEIELISQHLKPDYAIITNSGSAHVGRLGTLDNIAIAKCEITTGLKHHGTLIAKDQQIIKNHNLFSGESIYYSLEDVNIIQKLPSYTKFEYKNEIYELNVDGDYNVENSLSAIELAFKTGMSTREIKKGLLTYQPIEKRWEVQKINEIKFINDSYNANPESMKASVKTFVELYKNPVVVLGNMGELGENELEYHREVGKYLSKITATNVKYLTIGNLANEIGKELMAHGFEVSNFTTNKEAACYILDKFNNNYTIFLKASRAMKFEEIIEETKRGISK